MNKSKRRPAAPGVPTYLRHKSGGRDRAFCYISEGGNRRRVYLGRWGSAESRRRFREVVSRQLAEDTPPDTPRVPARAEEHLTIGALVARFMRWAETHYVKHGRLTGSWTNMRESPLCQRA